MTKVTCFKVLFKVSEEQIIMDFNHPMAGKDLYFKGAIQELRDATEEEVEHGHVHGEGGHQH